MAQATPLPPKSYLEECFTYDQEKGELRWRCRPREHFSAEWLMQRQHTRFGGEVTGSPTAGYLAVYLDGVLVKVHRVIWQLLYGDLMSDEQIDHIDRDPSNNRLANLRKCSQGGPHGNARNKGQNKNNTSGVNGVTIDASGRFRVRGRTNGNTVALGTFLTLDEAANAREVFNKANGYHPQHGQATSLPA